jgi:hypothetical protein
MLGRYFSENVPYSVEIWINLPHLSFASYLGLAQVVDDILTLEHADVNARSRRCLTALQAAMDQGHLEVMQVLFNGSDEVKITEDMVEAVARNGKNAEAVMRCFLTSAGMRSRSLRT